MTLMTRRSAFGLILICACGPATSRTHQAIDSQATFLHNGFGVGPALFTDATGAVLEERRAEPFGAPIDTTAFDLNTLNKRTEASTGWSDHGARWFAPETARWLSTDPPVEGPSASFMSAPWALHPYQYVDQNPIAYWDPDGRDATLVERSFDEDAADTICREVKKPAPSPAVPTTGTVHGRLPVNADGNPQAFYSYAGDQNPPGDTAGVVAGVGMLNTPNAALFRADIGIGKWKDVSGTTNYGVDGQVDAAKVSLQPGQGLGWFGFDGGLINGDLGIYGTDGGDYSVGAQMNIADYAVTVGNDERSVRAGWSMGGGFAGRLHTGNDQIGFGFDIAFVEFDVKVKQTDATGLVSWLFGN